MFFYLGHKAEIELDEKLRLARNKAKSWKYGYDPEYNVVIISRDGTLGHIQHVYGINIGLPEQPEHKKIENWNKTKANQFWTRHELPENINLDTEDEPENEAFIKEEFRRRREGHWIYLNGKVVFLSPVYYFTLQWIKEASQYPKLRVIQNELMLFWEACKADERCYGMQYVKNRRFGASLLGIAELLEYGISHMDKILGMISKKGKDAKKIFNRLVRSFKRLPYFFQPQLDGTTTPKTELIFAEQTRKRKVGEKISGDDEGLNTSISWHNTEINAMDGEEIARSLLDESGKYPPEVPFNEYWTIVKTSHRKGSNIVGKSMVVSTVNAKKKGGAQFKEVWDASDAAERNRNDQTKSGLYRIFIEAEYCLEGFFDIYGFSIVEDPKEPMMNDLGKMVSIGAATFLDNELDALKDKPEEYNEHRRQFPRNIRDAFRDEATDCSFNLMKLNEQIDYNEYDLLPDEVERGNFSWANGKQDTEAIWNPDPENGRFYIAKDCHPPGEFRNVKEQRFENGVLAWAPVAAHVGCFGIDPYNRSKTVDGRGSMGSIHLSTKTNTTYLPNEAFILEYIARPRRVEDFIEDVILSMVYYSMPILPELSSEKFLTAIEQRGYRNFVMNNPFKNWAELSDTERKYGGAPPQDTKIGDQQFYAIESYVEDHIGIARDNRNRPIGEMGYMPFTRTLMQWKDVDPSARTKYDAYISSSLSRLGNQRILLKTARNEQIENPFTRYNNRGHFSTRHEQL